MQAFLNNALHLLNMPEEEINFLKQALNPNSTNRELLLRGNSEFSSEMKISVVKQLLNTAYIPLLQDIIYSQCSLDELKNECNIYVERGECNFYSLFSVADMIIRYNNFKAVVTYNYDNFLSTAIKLLQSNKDYIADSKRCINKEFTPIDVYNQRTMEPNTDSSFRIYHVHGYIQPPYELKPIGKNEVVMSLDEFHQNSKDPYSWHETKQISYLSEYTCLYIGASLSDMTMQRVIHHANIQDSNENIYYLTKKGDTLTKLKNMFHTANHLKVIEIDTYKNFFEDINHKK
ncbi:MAG: SIR2 family protein [Bacteroidales bacterium]|nr:SIR2 family protein [Bacteroidales bacterium]